jgi:hypothetical protein
LKCTDYLYVFEAVLWSIFSLTLMTIIAISWVWLSMNAIVLLSSCRKSCYVIILTANVWRNWTRCLHSFRSWRLDSQPVGCTG